MTVRVVRFALLLVALCGAVVVHSAQGAATQASQATERGPARPPPLAQMAEDASNARVIVQFRASSALMRTANAKGPAVRPQHGGERVCHPLEVISVLFSSG